MLIKYYKLAVKPLGVTPDPAFFFFNPTHPEAVVSMPHGIRFGRRFRALIEVLRIPMNQQVAREIPPVPERSAEFSEFAAQREKQ
jgi:hypothetical protein